MPVAPQERSHTDQVRMVARRFHEIHEKLYASQRTGEPPRDWDEMPDSYHRRVLGTFDSLVRMGLVAPGPVVGWERPESE